MLEPQTRDNQQRRLAAALGLCCGLTLIVVATIYIGWFFGAPPAAAPPDDPPRAVESSPHARPDDAQSPQPTANIANDVPPVDERPSSAEADRRDDTGDRFGQPFDKHRPPEGQADLRAAPAEVRNVTVRDQEGRIEFQGDVDLAPTLARIARGERLRFAHDGARFQNRERQLPHKPAGYYHEYVHPTPGVGGPGAQRVIVGRQGEIYYTSDHYRTFRRIK